LTGRGQYINWHRGKARIEYALRQEGVHFMRRIDVARFWTATFPPAAT
jgi:hypothetical protein